MNRRGFLGSVAGAFVGGAFHRLAPAPKPTPPLSWREWEFIHLFEAETRASMEALAQRLATYAPQRERG